MTIARTATPSTARAINDRLALDLLLAHGPLTAPGLRDLTGLSRPTVADLLERLQRGGLVAVVGESSEQRRGPNARLYALVADRAHLGAIDVRSTGVSLVIADLTGRTLATAEIPAGSEYGEDLAERTVRTLLSTAAEVGVGHLHTVAVGAPGVVDPATGVLNNSGRLPRWHAELLEALRAQPETEVILENEVNLAGIAEHRIGAAQGREDFVLLWLGHGVGASVVLNGRLRRGASGGTGEIGFLPVPGTEVLPSATGCDGGFHSTVSSAAICALAREYGLEVPPGGPVEQAVGVLRSALEKGESAFLAELAERIAVGVSAVCVVIDPGCVVLGGEIGRAGGAALAELVERRLAGLSPFRTEVRAGSAGGGAVLAGAVLTAGDAVRRDLFGEP
ncbi:MULTISPECIES: ROK family transcriptional regulator [unclassified Kitasatospora]|uniref:ROK family transcriptional regulator n=1 Tax=unclassified Kitasatospora TaxID=2633591 RepID=UPI00070FD75C|nr:MULTISPECIES: ROK family transcriptional regulator [unclassified Kitasatospora]KQV14569.1 transcriptional regulator [Kitasatospora sp. Root107]KRB68109.1 transcriptional regulator [Kitasatospora sp. Root187]